MIEEPKAHFEDTALTVTTNETYQLPDQNDEDDAKESDHLIARNGFPRMSVLEKKQSIDENKNFETQSNISSESIAEDLKCLDINDLFNISIQVANGMKVSIAAIRKWMPIKTTLILFSVFGRSAIRPPRSG